jgi:hypothetical protein
MLKQRLFKNQHAEISPEVLLGALIAIGMTCDCWRRDGIQIYRYHDQDDSMLHMVSKIFNKGMKDAIAADSASTSMDLQKDSEYAPTTNAERARLRDEMLAAEEDKKKKLEEEKKLREEAAKNSKAIRSDVYVHI